MEVLGKNINNKVFFAAEGTNPTGTTHGAFLSGLRVSKEINNGMDTDYSVSFVTKSTQHDDKDDIKQN